MNSSIKSFHGPLLALVLLLTGCATRPVTGLAMDRNALWVWMKEIAAKT